MSITYRAAVDHLVHYAITLLDSLDKGEPRSFDREQSTLINELLNLPGDVASNDNLGPRYALACWLDEVFIHDSPWSAAWNENKLETRLFGMNDRAWEFWRQAEAAECRADEELLWTLTICVALGFQGQLRNNSLELARWTERMQTRVTRHIGSSRTHDALGAILPVPPKLTGQKRLHGAMIVATITMLISTPMLTYTLVQYLLR